jgi:hypothetical protein
MEVISTLELEREEEASLEPINSFSLCQTPKTLIQHEHYSSYINSKLASIVDKTIELTPIVARVIEKRDKGAKIMLLNGVLVEEELPKRKEAEARKARRRIDGNRTV